MFRLDPILEKDSVFMVDWPLSQVRLKNDSRFSWFLLVPRIEVITEIFDLESFQQHQLMEEITLLSQFLKRSLQAYKLNVAALGNKIAQLHVHVIGRSPHDPAWPDPVWGLEGEIPYENNRIETLKSQVSSLKLA